MRSIITICAFFFLETRGLAEMVPDDVACYRQNLKRVWFGDQQETPKTFLNMVEKFSEMGNFVMTTAGERLLDDTSLSLIDLLHLAVRRRSSLFYLFFASSYLYWLWYIRKTFKESRFRFDEFFELHCGFYSKKLLVLIFAVFVALLTTSAWETLELVRRSSEVSVSRESHASAFMQEYERVINHTSHIHKCFLDKGTRQKEEVEGFYARIRKRFQRRLTAVRGVGATIHSIVRRFQEDCETNETTWCGIMEHRRIMKSSEHVEKIRKTSDLSLETGSLELSISLFEDSKENTLNKMHNVDVSGKVRERLMRIRGVYSRIEKLFTIPPPLLLQIPFYLLFVFIAVTVLFSTVSLLTMLRDNSHLRDIQKSKPIECLLQRFSVFVLSTAVLALFWFFMIVILGTSAHSLFLNVLRDKEMEVLGKMNVSVANDSTASFGDFLKSNIDLYLEDEATTDFEVFNSDDWQESTLRNLELCSPELPSDIQSFCGTMQNIFATDDGKWVEERKKEFQRVGSFCEIVKATCFQCEFKRDLNLTKERITERKRFIENWAAEDLEEFKFLHEQYRVQIWNDFVVPVTRLEAPSLVLIISLFVLYAMHLISISFSAMQIVEPSCANHYEFYDNHSADRGLIWYNL